ncbi:ISL3 family transposase [bacterium]|nr:ISL3 family transposase [bacterium]
MAGQPVHDTVDKEWRHMDFFQHTCYLHARVPRVRCDACGVQQVTVPWARPGSGFTLLFEALAMSMAPHMPVADIARQFRIHDTRLWRILRFHIARAREHEDYSTVECIALDETSRRRRHRYVSIVTDADARRVLFACEGRGQDVLGRFADDFHAHGSDPDEIRVISMVMSPAFIAGVREVLPNAHMTFDRFHIMKLPNEALDRVRREEAQENPHLKGRRFLWLRRPRQLSVSQERKLSDLRYCAHKTNNAYALVLGLRAFFDIEAHQSVAYLKRWYHWTRCSRIEQMKEFALTIKRHWDGVLRFHQSHMTAGFLEGINSLVQASKLKARGYRSTDNWITMIYLIAGKLDYQLTYK